MRVAIVGVTGLVGKVMLKVLEERNFPVDDLIPIASQRSVGKIVRFKQTDYKVIDIQTALDNYEIDICLFSAGGETSRKWAPKFAEKGTYVIDNSSAWRMEPNVPLIVPEVNASELNGQQKIIANPNCSTIQMVVALKPIHERYGLKRLVISTYQSFTGTGKAAVDQYTHELSGDKDPKKKIYPHPIFENCLPHCDVFLEDGYTKEELKLVNETRKILNAPELAITATAVRVPVFGGHSESINVETVSDFNIELVKQQLASAPGVILEDDPSNNSYPMPLMAHNKDEVFVGRIRRDHSIKNGLNIWIVADNLRKGAATNAIQVAEYLISNVI